MSDSLDLQLDSFERRLRELERELAGLRRSAAVATSPPPTVDPVAPLPMRESRPPVVAPKTVEPVLQPPAWLAERLEQARGLASAGRLKDALRVLESARASALAQGDLAGLAAILQATESVGGGATGSIRSRAARLAYATAQNIRFLERKTGLHRPAADARRVPEPQLERPSAPPSRAATTAAQPPASPRQPLFKVPEITAADLLGARALAFAGGVVTLLGIVFFFVLAVNRGWIGPVGRVGLGGVASLLVFASGFELRRRYQDTHSSLAAVGVGIAGGFVTLLAAAALYHLLPDYAALLVCAGIAAVGLATSLAWRSQTVAGFGLIGAMLVPVAVVAQSGLSVLGTAFVAVVLAAAALVSLRRGWRELLVASGAVSLPQISVLAAQAEYQGQGPWRIVVLVAAFSLLYLGSGVAYQVQRPGAGLEQVSTSFMLGSGVLAALAAARLFGELRDEGIAFTAIALGYLLLAAALYRRRAARDVSAFLSAIGLTVAAVAVADLLSGQPLAYAWVAEAALLAWLARRVRELRYQVWAVVYLGLTLLHVLILDAPPTHLFRDVASPASGAATAVALAVALGVFARYARPWPERFANRGGLYGLLAPFFSRFEELQGLMRAVALWLGGVLVVYAASLGTLGVSSSFDWGHVAVAGLWSAVGLGIVSCGLRLDLARLRFGGLSWLGATAVAVLLFDGKAITAPQRYWAFLAVAAALLAAGVVYQVAQRQPRGVAMDVSAGLAVAGVAFAMVASGGLLDGHPVVYVWASGAAALAWLGWRLRALHHEALSLAVLLLALGHTLAYDSPPARLLAESDRPAAGVLAVVACAIAATAVALHAQLVRSASTDAFARYEITADLLADLPRQQPVVRDAAVWLVGALLSYTASLGTLALSASFDWGHVGVAAIWCAGGLGALVVGVVRGSRQLRNGGVAWLGTTVAAVALHGSISVEPTPRAWSFAVLAVAALAASYVYQLLQPRLAALAPVSIVFTLTAAGFGAGAIRLLLDGVSGAVDPEGAALLGLSGLFGLLAGLTFRRPGQRDYSTLLGAVALGVGVAATSLLLDGAFLVLAWAAAGGALAWLSRQVREPRLLVGSGAFVALALGHAVVLDGPPAHLFSVRVHPGGGAPAVLLAAAALSVLAHHLVLGDERVRRLRAAGFWITGILGVYGLSLAILDGVQRAFPDVSLQASFQRGHTAVSAFWGLVGLGLLYAGLKRWRGLRIAGFAVLGISLAKIFLYDLPSLSSVTRALSFLAVGAVLLFGGFLYQRLADAEGASTDAQST